MEATPMPRFFAHVRTATDLIPDGQGFELANLKQIDVAVSSCGFGGR